MRALHVYSRVVANDGRMLMNSGPSCRSFSWQFTLIGYLHCERPYGNEKANETANRSVGCGKDRRFSPGAGESNLSN